MQREGYWNIETKIDVDASPIQGKPNCGDTRTRRYMGEGEGRFCLMLFESVALKTP